MKASELLQQLPSKTIKDEFEDRIKLIKETYPSIDDRQVNEFRNKYNILFDFDNIFSDLKTLLKNNKNIDIDNSDYKSLQFNGISKINEIISSLEIKNLDLKWTPAIPNIMQHFNNIMEREFISNEIINNKPSWRKTIEYYIENISKIYRLIRLENLNKILENSNTEKESEISKKEEIIEKIEEEQTNKLLEWFGTLKNDFLVEEKRWISMWWVIFFCLLIIVLIPLFDSFIFKYTYHFIYWWTILILMLLFLPIYVLTEEKEKVWVISKFWENKPDNSLKKERNKKTILNNIWFLLIYFSLFLFWYLIPNSEKQVFQIDTKYWLIPLYIILFSFLYFSLYQYSKAKQLRIENQNKIALIHWILSMEWKNYNFDISKIYENFANVVFTKVYFKKTSNDLPIDKVIDLAKSIIDRAN